MDMPSGGFLTRQTTMPSRTQRTPHGDVTLASRWKRDRYLLTASGSVFALQWLFPKHASPFEAISPTTSRHVFVLSPKPITVERELRQVCAKWQGFWDEKYEQAVNDG